MKGLSVTDDKCRVVIISNTSWSLLNFREGLINAMVDAGHEVLALAPRDAYTPRLQELGAQYIEVPMDNGGTSLVKDFKLFMHLMYLFIKHRPDVVLGFTVKPNIYGSLAGRFFGIPVVCNISGLGAVFAQESRLTKLVRQLYRLTLLGTYKVFFQNLDDQKLFVEKGLVDVRKAERLPGSGVDLQRFQMTQDECTLSHTPTGAFRFLLVARMLWDKGIADYVRAAELLKAQGYDIDCCMMGFADVLNPSAIPRGQIDQWVASGSVRYLGVSDDIRQIMQTAQCVVLPSYYKEGVPRCLLEAAALQRPVITTDISGCRDAAEDQVTGLLCKARDPQNLALKMEQILLMHPTERQAMGQAARQKMEREFDETLVIQRYLDTIHATMVKSPN